MKKRICIALCVLVVLAAVLAGTGIYLHRSGVDLDAWIDDRIGQIESLFGADQPGEILAAKPLDSGIASLVSKPVEAVKPYFEQPPVDLSLIPLPEPEPLELEESWFDDALFIGNSLTVGLREFARLGDADYFCGVGTTLYSIRDTWAYDLDFRICKLETLLSIKKYKKVYISLGINEVGYPVEDLIPLYQDLIDLIRKYQQDALIIIQSVMAVGRTRAENAWYFRPEHIASINEAFASLADGEMIRFVDVNEWIADEEGYLPYEFSSDGCHPYYEGYIQWSQWILEKCGEFGIP